ADGTYKVERNRFYKIEVKSIKNLGVHSEDLLRPKDPTCSLGNLTSAWIETVLTVAPWEEVNQDADL
ncbi:MAG: fimbria major subunit, partial [Muribaculaceae bacterium]|nr:fimbria major subunit [Muribaculaceae bacterium]